MPALALVGATLAVYANTLAVPLMLDDVTGILLNPSIWDLRRIGAVLWPGPASTTAGRPLLNLSFAANYAWSGAGVGSYHVVNLAIHLAAGLTLFAVAARTFERLRAGGRFPAAPLRAVAWVIALLWMLHPLQTEAVTYVSQRAESLMGWCYLLTLYGLIRSPGSRRPNGWLLFSVGACAAGMATKEVMVTAPALMLLYDRAFLSPSFRQAWSVRRWYYSGLGLTWCLLGFLMAGSRLFSARAVGFRPEVSAFTYALTETEVIVGYAKLAVWPSPLVFDYGAEILLHRLSQAAPYVLCLVVAVAGTAGLWRRSKALGFVAASFFILLAPTSSFVPVVFQPMAESRMYLPLAALVVLAALAAWAAAGRAGLVALTVWAAGLGVLSHRRNGDYRTALGICADTIAKRPANSREQYNLGVMLARIPGRRAEAIAHYEEALRLRPNLPDALNNLGTELARIPGRQDEAVADYERALSLEPDRPESHYGLGDVLALLPGRRAEAIEHLERAVQLAPLFVEAHARLAHVLADLPSRREEALAEFAAVAAMQPDSFAAHRDLAGELIKPPGRWRAAMLEYQRMIQLRPGYAPAHNNLAGVYARIGRRDEAVRELERAHQLDPKLPAVRRNLELMAAPSGKSAAETGAPTVFPLR